MNLDSRSWRVEPRVQKGGVEYIRDIKEITKIFIKQFGINTKRLPENIIMIRDGVGEGQFIPVLQKEVKDIKEACKEIKPTYNPRVTFLVRVLYHCDSFIFLIFFLERKFFSIEI